MTMPFGYVSPEQQMKDKADYARKGIARGRSVVVLQYDDGILFVSENPAKTLHKISELYDRIAFRGGWQVQRVREPARAGIRIADVRGYSYDRRDVTGRSLANAYAQTLGAIFTETNKPYEVELVVAEVGDTAEEDQIYRLTYDGSIADEHGYVAMGGNAEQIARRCGAVLRRDVAGRGPACGGRGPDRRLGAAGADGVPAGGRRPRPQPPSAQVPPADGGVAGIAAVRRRHRGGQRCAERAHERTDSNVPDPAGRPAAADPPGRPARCPPAAHPALPTPARALARSRDPRAPRRRRCVRSYDDLHSDLHHDLHNDLLSPYNTRP